MSLKLLIVDDHEVVRRGVTTLLQSPGLEIVGIVGDGQEAVDYVTTNPPDAVLMDVRMQGMDGLAALDLIRRDFPDLPVVMLSTYDNPTYIARSVALGASDYVLKGDSREHILDAIHRAADRKAPSSDSILHRIRGAMDGEAVHNGEEFDLPLTVRELQVLRHIALGLSNKEIARSLSISVETVKEHVQNILRKLNAADRTDAAVRAVKLGVV
ncbi:response regulator [Candidatus Laterigemmans baculatus]|uniref:response regulator n=1 Tax=Candidatus Laterigemmans baculatus TaxID=2770505 RepID=UPI0013D9ECBB|nr:response regulator transcription factor [Candidatus Laterigemmans baculatus]